jgi:hypothetical protein
VPVPVPVPDPLRLLATLLLVSCARPAPAPPLAAPPAPAAAPPSTVASLDLRIASDPSAEGKVLIDMRLDGPLARASAFDLAKAHDVSLEAVVATDAAGDVPLTRTEHQGQISYAPSRPPRGALRIRYAVSLARAAGPDGPFAEPISLHADGEDLLLLPRTTDAFAVDLHLGTGVLRTGGASTLGLGVDQHAVVRADELRRTTFLAGDVGSARFHASDGDDFAAWLGFTAFDPRWVAAQSAGIRSAVDAWVSRARTAETPPTALLFVAEKQRGPTIAMRTRARGLLATVDPRAPWTPTARILVAQALTQQYVGRFLAVVDANGADAGFFSDGFSRAIGRDVLFDAGALDVHEAADEVNALLAATVFAKDERTIMTARGALAATALDIALRSSRSSLRTFIRERLTDAARTNDRTLTFDAFLMHVRSSAGEPAARALADGIGGRVEVALPPDLLGACYRVTKKMLVPFELGFEMSPERTITSVVPHSRAEAAGLRVGDRIEEIHYDDGKSSKDVEILREGAPKKLRFRPAGAEKPGRTFERVPGIPAERC